jgi:hypothetical protein
MDATDAFFTQTIVGPPLTVMMGRRLQIENKSPHGLEINLASNERRLSRLWQDWVVLSHEEDAVGTTRRRPGRLRRQLERHGLWLAIFGLGSLAATAIFWGMLQWS